VRVHDSLKFPTPLVPKSASVAVSQSSSTAVSCGYSITWPTGVEG